MMDDLSDLIAQRWTHDSGPRPGFGPTGTPAQYGQGTVVAWNTETGENQIRYHGSILRNLPIISSTDILVTRPGDQVAIMSWAPNGGSGAYWIMGRLVVPGTESAARSIQFLQSDLAKTIVDELVEQLLVSPAGQELAAFVIGQRVHSGTVTAQATTTSTSFTNLSGSTGPTVSNVDVSDAGVAIVLLSCWMQTSIGSGPAVDGGYMGVEVSGASSQSPDVIQSIHDLVGNSSGDTGLTHAMRCTAVVPVTGLNSGLHTFQAKYRQSGAGDTTSFRDRTIVVIAL